MARLTAPPNQRQAIAPQVIEEGTLREVVAGAEDGRLAFRHWVQAHARIERSGEVVEQTYRLADDGRLLGIRQMIWRGPRELVTEDQAV